MVHPSSANQLHVAHISAVEVLAAITRRVRLGSLTPQAGHDAVTQFLADFGNYDVVAISEPLILRAMDFAEEHGLRGYDAVQSAAAAAVNVGAGTLGFHAILISADDELNAAAAAEGLKVENPNRYP